MQTIYDLTMFNIMEYLEKASTLYLMVVLRQGSLLLLACLPASRVGEANEHVEDPDDHDDDCQLQVVVIVSVHSEHQEDWDEYEVKDKLNWLQ